MVVFCARARANADLQRAGAPLGDRAVQTGGSAVPRGGTAGNRPVAEAPLPRQGAVAERRPGVLLFPVDCGLALGGAEQRQSRLFDQQYRCHLSGVRGDARFAHGAALDDTAAPGAGAASALHAGHAGGRPACGSVIASVGQAYADHPAAVPRDHGTPQPAPAIGQGAGHARS